jgi:hypothetical protein
LADTLSPRFLDWEHFYALAGEGQQQLPEYELRAELMAHGFSIEKAEHLAELTRMAELHAS